jgi:hypothetical protein
MRTTHGIEAHRLTDQLLRADPSESVPPLNGVLHSGPADYVRAHAVALAALEGLTSGSCR